MLKMCYCYIAIKHFLPQGPWARTHCSLSHSLPLLLEFPFLRAAVMWVDMWGYGRHSRSDEPVPLEPSPLHRKVDLWFEFLMEFLRCLWINPQP